jgi:HD superfamily phosphodiesterase
MNYIDIENKHKALIDTAINYLNQITDKEHDLNHTIDVVNFTKLILDKIDIDVNIEACIISAYWHDVGRLKKPQGHELLSATMLKEEMLKNNYPNNLIETCYKAIENHKWNMKPKTPEGLVIKDADKIAYIGPNRWQSIINNKKRIDEIISLLPEIRNNILYFSISKEIYDEFMVKLVIYLYNKIFEIEGK